MLLFIIQLVSQAVKNRAAATDKTCFPAPLCWHLYVKKELIHAFSLAYIELWMHLGRLESNRERRLEAGSYYICYRTEG